MLHFYAMVGLIPVAAIVFYANVFIGPAQLTPYDPEEETPKHWEFHRHPITRFIARYLHNNPQQVCTNNKKVFVVKLFPLDNVV